MGRHNPKRLDGSLLVGHDGRATPSIRGQHATIDGVGIPARFGASGALTSVHSLVCIADQWGCAYQIVRTKCRYFLLGCNGGDATTQTTATKANTTLSARSSPFLHPPWHQPRIHFPLNPSRGLSLPLLDEH